MSDATIWVDADGCPGVIRDILMRAANRTKTSLVLVANHAISVPPSAHITSLQVASGYDVADDEIEQRVCAGDLVITSDVPLADAVISRKALALSPRGELFSAANIKARLNMRDFMDTMRASGVQSGGPPPLSHADRQAFAAQLDRWLAKQRVQSRST